MKDKTKYNAYIASPEWQEKRKQVFEQKWCACEACGSTKYLHVHHWTYRRLYNEKIEDLFVLCGECHIDLHEKYGTKDLFRATKAFIKWAELIPRKSRWRKSLEQRKKDREARNRNKLNLIYATTIHVRLIRQLIVTRTAMVLAKKFDERKYRRFRDKINKRKNKEYREQIKITVY